MEKLSFMYDMIESELRDAVGYDNVGTDPDELLSYGTDYYWIARMWMDKGQEPPKGRARREYLVSPFMTDQSLGPMPRENSTTPTPKRLAIRKCPSS